MEHKKISSVLLLFVMFVGIMAGCQKEDIASNTDDFSLLQSEVTAMSKSYVAKIEPSVAKAPWKKILGADLKGALDGAAKGAVIGSVVPGLGTANGAAAGAIIGGAAASFDAAGLSAGNGGTGIGNPNNEFDFVGSRHYFVLDVIYTNPNFYVAGNNNGLEYQTYYDMVFGLLVADGLVTPQHRSNLPEASFESSHPNYLGEESILAFSNNLNNPNYEPGERAIMAQYFGALMSSNNAEDFANYSIGVENLIASSNMSEKSKAILLSEMATARHGMAYWM